MEALTRGSIVLAGILLKLGGYGLIRFNVFIDKNILIFFVYGLLIRTISCCIQLDIKRIIAYSSVSHIILILFLIINNRILSFKIINIIMFSHAFSRMILFYWVGLVYKCIHTRNLILLKGIFYNYLQLVFIFIIMIIININILLFIGYFREILGFYRIIQFRNYIILILILYFIFSIVYIINILSIIFLYNKNNYSFYIVRIKENILIFYIVILNIIFIFKIEIF